MQFVEIHTPITQARASRIIQDFNKAERVVPPVANESNPPPITITINSTGGSVEGGYRILREIENSPSQIHFKCDKQAFSIAATIFISATGRNRDATEECKLMIHEPYITAYNPNAPKRKTTRTKYEACCRITVERWKTRISKNFLSPKEELPLMSYPVRK